MNNQQNIENEKMYKLNKQANSDGTSLRGNVTISTKRLTELFGLPSSSDGYKSSGEYIFTSEAGDVFTLYDWKSTSLYDDKMIAPEEFWNQSSPVTLNIGAKSTVGVGGFMSFLTTSLRSAELGGAR